VGSGWRFFFIICICSLKSFEKSITSSRFIAEERAYQQRQGVLSMAYLDSLVVLDLSVWNQCPVSIPQILSKSTATTPSSTNSKVSPTKVPPSVTYRVLLPFSPKRMLIVSWPVRIESEECRDAFGGQGELRVGAHGDVFDIDGVFGGKVHIWRIFGAWQDTTEPSVATTKMR